MVANLKQRNQKFFSADWFSRNIILWKNVLGHLKSKKLRVLEVGVFEGRSTVWILEELFSHPDSQIIVIDSFVMGSKRRFISNIKKTGKYSQVKIIIGNSRDILLKLNTQKTRCFDFIYIDGAHDSQSVLNDAILSWELLAPGGIIIFDDYDLKNVELAIDSLLNCYLKEIKIINLGHQVILRRVRGGYGDRDVENIKNDTELRTLDLSNNFVGDDGVKRVAQKFPLLTTLDLSNNRIGPKGAKIIAYALPNLQKLNLANNYIGDNGAREIGNKLINLKNLNLCENQIGCDGGKVIGESLGMLTTLNLHENKIGKVGAQCVSKNLLKLKELNLCGNQIGDRGALSILESLSNLRALDLGGNQISLEGFKKIAPYFSSLIYLSLVNGGISDVEVNSFLPYLTQLSELDLSENRIEFKDVELLSKDFSRLIRLNLRENKIDNNGLSFISQQFLQLESLELSFNKITDNRLDILVSKFSKLKLLDLHENNIQFAGARKICYALPQVFLDLRGNAFSQVDKPNLLDLQQKSLRHKFFYWNDLQD